MVTFLERLLQVKHYGMDLKFSGINENIACEMHLLQSIGVKSLIQGISITIYSNRQ